MAKRSAQTDSDVKPSRVKSFPKQADLPGATTRIKRLSELCASIADARRAKNEAATDEASFIASSLEPMKRAGIEQYTDHGVVLTLTISEQVHAKLTKAHASQEPEATPAEFVQ